MARNADAAAIGDAFQPGSDIDPVAKNVTAVGNDVADIDANAEFQALVRRYLRISSDDAALNFDRTSDRVHDARKLGEDAIACGVGDVAAVPLDRGIAEFAAMSPQLGMRAFLVGTHQPAVSSHVGRENGREVASNSRLFQISAPRTRNKILPISARPDQKRESPLVCRFYGASGKEIVSIGANVNPTMEPPCHSSASRMTSVDP